MVVEIVCVRGLYVRGMCVDMLLDVVLHVDLVVDGRQWQLEPTKCYIVICVYHLLSTTNQTIHSTLSNILFYKKTTLKVTVFTLVPPSKHDLNKIQFIPTRNPFTKLPIMCGGVWCGRISGSSLLGKPIFRFCLTSLN